MATRINSFFTFFMVFLLCFVTSFTQAASVATGVVTYGDKAELLDVQYQEVTKQAGVLTKLAVKLAANAVGLGPWAEFALQAGVDSAISGEIDVEAITKDAAFKYASAELSAYAKAELGIPAPAEGQYFGGNFLQNTAVDATVNALTQTAIYGGSFSENLTDSYESALITEVTALGQNFVGDIKGFEGSPIGLIGHGVVAGTLFSGGDTDKVKELIRNKVNPTLAALTSGGDLGQFSINQGIADSQLKNNYLTHPQLNALDAEKRACRNDNTPACYDRIYDKYAAQAGETLEQIEAICQRSFTECEQAYYQYRATLDRQIITYENEYAGLIGTDYEELALMRLDLMELHLGEQEQMDTLLGQAKARFPEDAKQSQMLDLTMMLGAENQLAQIGAAGLAAGTTGFLRGLGGSAKGKGNGGLWTSTKNFTSTQNALWHWNKHKSEFPELHNSIQYAREAKKFLQNPPSGTLVKTRQNGEILKYNPMTNTFGVMTKDGTPKTMFRPKQGINYWNRQ